MKPVHMRTPPVQQRPRQSRGDHSDISSNSPERLCKGVGKTATMILSLSLLLVSIAGLEAAQPETSRDNLRSLLTDHFTTPRHHVTNPDGLVAAENFIYDTFKSYNMQVVKHDFILVKNGDRHPGVNVVGLWPGRYFMTPQDRPFMLTAHYESPYDMSGVEDNGSGLAALLESARLITSQPCLQDYTVVFTAFDYSANFERDLQTSPCETVACGCRQFVHEVLVPFMSDSHIGPTDIQGIIVMDGLLNYNNTPGAQEIPSEDVFRTVPGLSEAANLVRADGYRGNFVTSIYREVDSPLAAAFNNKFDEAADQRFKIRSLTLPFSNITDQTKQDPLWPLFNALIDADIKALYEVIPDVKAMLLTDTVHLRGREKDWQSLTASDSMTITAERLDFLKKTTDAVTRMVEDLTGHKETCGKDPLTEFPGQAGFQMRGELQTSTRSLQNVTLTVHDVKPHGVVTVTLSGETWRLPMTGMFDPLDHILHLVIQEPVTDLDGMQFGTLTCKVIGRFRPRDSGVMFTGRMRGHCSSTLSFFGDGGFESGGFMALYSGKVTAAGSSGPSLALPVVLSLLGGMAFSAALAAVAWFLYTKRLAKSTTNSLPMKENQ
ncbi:uncharacterized protein LOC118415887 isoform X2 [Branchiostoma floridae]|uniref:Uncharacterized protein LOC118415887 isoform X2 n=1 Tax=Branchiostoma floridae TaxID=7739 RepID=A0A9J7L690_BRAFL|nr:uncharacterized protein LOC118415887 isoform X2 [Branchiostoma floridae]